VLGPQTPEQTSTPHFLSIKVFFQTLGSTGKIYGPATSRVFSSFLLLPSPDFTSFFFSSSLAHHVFLSRRRLVGSFFQYKPRAPSRSELSLPHYHSCASRVWFLGGLSRTSPTPLKMLSLKFHMIFLNRKIALLLFSFHSCGFWWVVWGCCFWVHLEVSYPDTKWDILSRTFLFQIN